jgi:hypothetical protein
MADAVLKRLRGDTPIRDPPKMMVDATMVDAVKLWATILLESTRVLVFTLLMVREPALFWIFAEPKTTWLTVGAEIVLVTWRIPIVAPVVAWTEPVLRYGV